jgi:hypothetical protein
MALKIGGKKKTKNKSARHKAKRLSKKKRMTRAKTKK